MRTSTADGSCTRSARMVTGTLAAVMMLVGIAALGAQAEPASEPTPSVSILTTWSGPYGGLPPLDRATPASLESAIRSGIEAKRADITAITSNPKAPTFENTVLALDSSGKPLARAQSVLQELLSTASTDELRAVAGRVLPLSAALENEIAFNDALYARIDAVFRGLPASAPTPEARRLVTVMRADLLHRGAGLDAAGRLKLKSVNARLTTLMSEFAQNTSREEEALVVYVDDVTELKGLPDDRIAAAKAAATQRGKPESWAIPMQRPAVWPVLTRAESRPLRERVFKLWESRGNNRGTFDNGLIITEILKLRGERARILGYPTYGHYATARRMAGTPDVALAMVERAWKLLLPVTRLEIANLQRVADAEHANITIEPWDRLYYAEKYRQQEFGLDSDAVRPYLSLQNTLDGMMWAAGRTYGLSFRELNGIPVISPDIRVYEVSRGQDVVGVLYLDLFQRKGKGPASWTTEARPAEHNGAAVLPIAMMHSNVVHPADGSEPQLSWEVANVLFHEFGHALHMLSNHAPYVGLGSLQVPWDFIEVPSLLNERWLLDRAVLSRFARHRETGEAMPAALIDKVERALRHDRVFSVNLEFLATALVDLHLHALPDTSAIDAVDEERKLLAKMEMPSAVTPLLRVSNAFHIFTEAYGAGVYTYLWSDAIAADIAEGFLAAPGGLYDPDVAARYRRTILEAGATRPMSEAFREFRGHDPDPDALFRRFGLLPDTGTH